MPCGWFSPLPDRPVRPQPPRYGHGKRRGITQPPLRKKRRKR